MIGILKVHINSKKPPYPPFTHFFIPSSQFVCASFGSKRKAMAQVIVELDASGNLSSNCLLPSHHHPKRRRTFLCHRKFSLCSLLSLEKCLRSEKFELGEQMVSEKNGNGRGATAPRPVIIPLPDDNEEVFTIYQIAHHKMDRIPDTLKPEALAKFAQICQKYDRIKPFTYSTFRSHQLDLRPCHPYRSE